jgi:hypothetical protein
MTRVTKQRESLRFALDVVITCALIYAGMFCAGVIGAVTNLTQLYPYVLIVCLLPAVRFLDRRGVIRGGPYYACYVGGCLVALVSMSLFAKAIGVSLSEPSRAVHAIFIISVGCGVAAARLMSRWTGNRKGDGRKTETGETWSELAP